MGFEVFNGGVPQNLTGGLDAHVQWIQRAVDLTLPADFAGYLGLDYEAWEPIVDKFLFEGYVNVSQQIVMEAHPTWNATRIAAEAEAEFNAAAKVYYQTTVRTLKSLRPKMKVGFYDSPGRLWHSYWDPEAKAGQQAHNDALVWLWDEVDFFSPVLYIKAPHGSRPPSPYEPNNASFVRQLLGETQRLADIQNNASRRAAMPLPVAPAVPPKGASWPPPRTVQPTRPIVAVPFSWMRVDGTTQWLQGADLEAEFKVPFEFPVIAGNAVWGNPAVGKASIDSLHEYYDKTFVPFASALMEQRCDCQAKQCSDHGRCVLNDTACECLPGWTGADCSSQDTDFDASAIAAPAVTPTAASEPAQGAAGDVIVCVDGMTTCPAGTTCAQLTTAMWGCCPVASAHNCGDFQHCCPQGHLCDVPNGVCYPDPGYGSA